jgi:hypothetical protein
MLTEYRDHNHSTIVETDIDTEKKMLKLGTFINEIVFMFTLDTLEVGWNRAIDIATRYGLDGPEIESRYWRDFMHSSRLALEHSLTPIQWVPCPFPGDKAAGVWR